MSVRLDHGSDELGELHEINVTPFIDVILVLLIIFMIAAPLATVDTAVDLPASTAQQSPRPDKPLFVTLNPDREPDPSKVFAEFSYEHPQFSADGMKAQQEIAAIQGKNNCYFAGAWTGYGFHEDGLVSGLAAAEALGGVIPWRTTGASSRAPLLEAVA